jgi:hypothetical protein
VGNITEGNERCSCAEEEKKEANKTKEEIWHRGLRLWRGREAAARRPAAVGAAALACAEWSGVRETKKTDS